MTKSRLLSAAMISLLAVLVGISSLFLVRKYVSQRRAKAEFMQQTLEKELSKIAYPSVATPIQHNSLYDSGQGTFSDYYRTSLTYDEIRAHYDFELAKRGWKFQGASKLTNWGADLGESERVYCKGVISADLYFTGQRDGFGLQIFVGLSWGLGSCN